MGFLDFVKSFFKKEKPTGKKATGFVQFFNHSRGYGFIQAETLDNRIFVHISELNDRVRKGDQVRFEIEPDPKGPRAKNVELV